MKTAVADMHCDTISALFQMRSSEGASANGGLLKNGLHIDLEKLEKGGCFLQNFALFVALSEHSDPLQACVALADLYYEELEKNSGRIRPVYCYEDIVRNRREGKLSALLTVEEGAVCKGRLDHLRLLYRLGVRMLTLTWNFPNELGWPNVRMPEKDSGAAPDFSTPDRKHGLTETGFAFLAEMERLGMIVDVSHLSDAGFWDVVRAAKKPFVASHSNARAVCAHVRNLDDDMIRALAEKGGITGLNFCPSFLKKEEGGGVSLDDIAAHARHIVNVGGEGCLGLGSDFDGIPTNKAIPDASCLPFLADALKKAGFSQRQIDGIFCENVLRVYREVLK